MTARSNPSTNSVPSAVRASAAAHFADQSAGAFDAIQRATDAAQAADQQLKDARQALAGAVADAQALSAAYQAELDHASRAARASRVLEPGTVLWALGNPVGWLIDRKNKRLPCLTGFRVIEQGQDWDYQQIWVSLEYDTLEEVRAAVAEARDAADQRLVECRAVRTGLVPVSAKVPGRSRISAGETRAIELAKTLLPLCRWATPAEVRAIESGGLAGFARNRAEAQASQAYATSQSAAGQQVEVTA